MAGEMLRYRQGSLGLYDLGTTPDWWTRTEQAAKDPNALTNWFWDPDQRQYLNVNDARGAASPYNPRRTKTPGTFNPVTDQAAMARGDINNLYRPVEVLKSPLLAGGVNDLMSAWKTGIETGTKGFNDYLNAFKTGSEAAYKAGNEAIGAIPATINTLRAGQAGYEGGLRSAAQDYANVLAGGAETQRGIIARDYAALPEYQAALAAQNAVTQDALVRAAKGTRVGAGGLPMGSDMARILARQSYEAALPYTMAGINRGYDIRGAERGVEAGITGQGIQYAGSFLPSIYGSIYTSGQNTAMMAQQLRNQVAGMTYENALRYMQSLGVPAQIQQQILSGNITNLGAIGNLENQAYYRSLQYLPGQAITPATNFYFQSPGYPTYDRRQPQGYVQAGGGYNPFTGSTGGGGAPYAYNGGTYGGADPNDPNYRYYVRSPKDWITDPGTGRLVYRPTQTGTATGATDLSYNPEIYNAAFENPLYSYSKMPGPAPETYGWGPLNTPPTYQPVEGYDPYWYERSQAMNY